METSPRTRQGVIEIELEELDEDSWRPARAPELADPLSSSRFRFIARLAHDPHTRFVGSPFAMPRSSVAGLSDHGETDLEARVRLGELDTALASAGWHDLPERGEHWWSLRYTRD